MKQETQFDAEIRVQDNAEKVFKAILPKLKTLTFKNYHVIGENLADLIEQNQFFCPRGAVYKAVRRLVVQNRGQLSVQRSLLAVGLTSVEVRLAQRKLARELVVQNRGQLQVQQSLLAAVLTSVEVRLAQRKLALELEIHRDSVSMIKRAIVAKCTFQDLLEDKIRAVLDVLKIAPDSLATLAEMLPDLREAIDLSEGDTIIMLRRLNTRLNWGLGDSDILCMFGLQIQTPE